MYKVLIISRDEFDAKGIQWLLESSFSNIKAEAAVDLTAACQLIEQLRPSFLIVEMDFFSGKHQEPFLKAVKIMKPAIIALTVEATFEAAQKAINLGVKKLLVKPFPPQDLMKSVQMLLKEWEAGDAIQPTERKKDKNGATYKKLFLPSSHSLVPQVLSAFKPEKREVLPSLYIFLQQYHFPNKPILFLLEEMIIAIFKKTEERQIDQTCKKLLSDWHEIEQTSLSIIINGNRQAGNSLHQQYTETKKMVEITFFVGYKSVLFFSKPLQWKFIDPFLTPQEQRLWISFLNEGDKKEIRSWLYREFLQFRDPYPDPSLLRIRLTSILAQLRRHMKTYHLDHQQKYEDAYLQMFEAILYGSLIYRIVQQLIVFASTLIDAVQQAHYAYSFDIIEKSLRFIETNYWNKQIDLQTLAKLVDRNPSYFSQLFAKKVGKNFRQKLNEIRVNEAKKLIVETDLSMKEIAALTGFQNQQYFSRIFHHYTGQAPRQYRSSQLQ